METTSEKKFNRIIKEGFQEILKPLGFRKKANNFYLKLSDLGQIINIQKSQYGSKDYIHFTINTGIFIPEYWLAYYTFHNNELPIFPIEPQCLIRKRIGELKKQNDTWYDLNPDINENLLIAEMQNNLKDVILPHFDKLKTKDDILKAIESEAIVLPTLDKVILYGEYKLVDKAKGEYKKLLNENTKNLQMSLTNKEYGQKYGLE